MRTLLFVAGLALVWACASGARWERGLYVFGAEVESFRPCGSDRELWVVADSAVLLHLRATGDSLVQRAYQPVYVEVRARRQEREVDGFAAEYDGQLHIDSVAVIRRTVPVDCPALEGSPSRPAS